MRVDSRVAQPPPAKNEATSRSADLGRNRTRAELPANPNRTRAMAGGPSKGGNSAAAAGGDREIIPHRDPGGGGSDGGSSNQGANRRASGGGDRGGRGHANSHVSRASQGGFDARQKIEELRRKKSATVGATTTSPPSLLGFTTCSSQKNSNLWESPSTTRSKTPSSGSDATPSPSRTLVATTTPSASTSPSAWTKPRSHGSSHSKSTRSTSGTS
jgi:hypothetical protein